MNEFRFLGRVASDPEIKTYSDRMVATYRVAVPRNYKSREGVRDTDFFTLVAFGKKAEFVEKYVTKGRQFLFIGEIRNNNYQNQDGKTVYGFEFIVNAHEFADSRGGGQNDGQGASRQQGGYRQQPAQGSYQQAPQGGYQKPAQGSYQQPSQGGYRQQPAQGGYQQAPQGGYRQQAPQGGYQQPAQGSYQQAPQGGYQQPAPVDGFQNYPDEDLPF